MWMAHGMWLGGLTVSTPTSCRCARSSRSLGHSQAALKSGERTPLGFTLMDTHILGSLPSSQTEQTVPIFNGRNCALA